MKHQVYLGLSLPTIVLEDTNCSGHIFRDFEPVKASFGAGWLIYGHNSQKYGTKPDGKGGYVKICAWPDKPKRIRYYNRPAYSGFKTKREALAVANALNIMFPINQP